MLLFPASIQALRPVTVAWEWSRSHHSFLALAYEQLVPMLSCQRQRPSALPMGAAGPTNRTLSPNPGPRSTRQSAACATLPTELELIDTEVERYATNTDS
jgi:hypothetical protein